MISRTRLACGLLVAALCLVAVGTPIQAQALPGQESSGGELRIQELKVQVLPEFDDPRTLVVVQGRLAAASPDFPQRVVFRLPVAAQINQMAVMDMTTGGVLSQTYESQTDPQTPEWALVSYSLDNPHFFYEYYVGSGQDQAQKSFVITFQNIQPIDHLLLEVAEPVGATDFSLEPAATGSRVDASLGLTYHQIELRDVAADESVSIAVGYVRESQSPSFVREETQPGLVATGSPANANAATTPVTRPATGNLWLWLFMPMGAAVVLVGALVVQRRLRFAVPGPQVTVVGQTGIYCRRCGAHLRADAQFCHLCGAEAPTAVVAQSEAEGSLSR